MIRRTKKKKGKLVIEEDGDIDEYIAVDEWEEGWVNDSKYCDEDGMPYDILDENGDFIE